MNEKDWRTHIRPARVAPIRSVTLGDYEVAALLVVCAQHGIQFFEGLPEHNLIVPPGEGDLKNVTPSKMGGQLGQALLA